MAWLSSFLVAYGICYCLFYVDLCYVIISSSLSVIHMPLYLPKVLQFIFMQCKFIAPIVLIILVQDTTNFEMVLKR